MRKVILGALICGMVMLLIAAAPTIHLFTDFPNATPIDSDFFVLQRNNSFINATPAQVRGAWFTSPSFTGNGTISGSFSAGGIFAGNGSGLTNVTGVNGGFVLSFAGFGTNESFYGPTTFLGTNNYGKLEIFDANSIYVAGFDTNKGGWWGFGNLINFTNFQPSILTVTADTVDPNARRIVAGANITLTDGGAGSTLTVSSSGTPPNGPAGGVLGGTYPNPSFGTFSSSTLGTALSDGTGKPGLAVFSNSPTETNTLIKGDQYGTNALSVSNSGVINTNNINGIYETNGTIYATGPITASGETNTSTLPNTIDLRDGNKAEGSLANGGAYAFLQGTTPPKYSTLAYSTNIVGAANFVFGKAYWTNITGNFTFPPMTEDPAAYETLVVMVTNSGASVFTATINGVSGAPGHVVPAVFNCTNATVTEIDLSHFGVQWTNACVGKN